jgi:hypothetical protein
MPNGPDGNRAGHDEAGSTLSPLERLVAAKQAEKAALRKRDSRALAALAVVAVLVVGGGVFGLVRADPSLFRLHAAAKTPAPKGSLAVTTRGPVITTGAPVSPFAGSPARDWADGAAGITIPAARAHGPFTSAQVRSAYERTRKILIAENLDPATLRGGAPSAFADLLIKQERTQFLDGLHTRTLAKDGTVQNTRTWVSSFAPGSAAFLTSVIKVHGTMNAGTARVSGTEVLRITFSYLFVYAVEQPGVPSNWTRVVQQRYGDMEFAQWDDPGGTLEPFVQVQGGPAPALCGERDGYIHVQFPNSPDSGPSPSGTPVNPYSPSPVPTSPVPTGPASPASSGDACQAITGT